MPAGNFFCGPSLFLKISTLFLFYFSALLQVVAAVPKNFTIDDQIGDRRTGKIPIYAPESAWANQACGGCGVKPDPVQLFEHTATAATFMPDKGIISNTADFDFNGTAIYIFFTLFYNEGEQITVNTECNFTLDNEPPVFFNHSGDPNVPARTKRDYQALVFSKTGLEYKPHHMRISMSDVPYHVFLSFDYAQYTVDDVVDSPTSSTTNLQTSKLVPSPTSSQSPVDSSPNKSNSLIGIVVGGVLGGLAVLAGFLGLLWLYRRDTSRYPKPSEPDPATPRPYVYSHMANSGQGASSLPLAWGIERTSTPSITGATGSPSFGTLSSTQALSADSPRYFSQTLSPGSNPQGSSVEHRIRDAHKRMQSLTAEIASASSRSNKSNTISSRETTKLVEEMKKLRREIQTLKQLQGSSLGPPPQYDE